MGIAYRVERDIVVVDIEGTVAVGDIRAYLQTARLDPTLPSGVPCLIDCRTVVPRLSSGDVRAIASEVRRRTSKGAPVRCAILAASDLAFGLLRMYEAFSEGSLIEVRVFRDRREALAWLSGRPSATQREAAGGEGVEPLRYEAGDDGS